MWRSEVDWIHKNIYNICTCLACRALKVQSPSASLRSKSGISPEQTSPESATMGSHDKKYIVSYLSDSETLPHPIGSEYPIGRVFKL